MHACVLCTPAPPGDVDLVAHCATTSCMRWYENNGSGNFTKHILNNKTFEIAISVTAGDLDNDGDIDLISGHQNGYKILW
jgi:hypothetical protein